MLFLGEKGQAKSRLMRSLVRFLDEAIPYLDPGAPVFTLTNRPGQRQQLMSRLFGPAPGDEPVR
jgi:Mg-chelatase subunit ChlI